MSFDFEAHRQKAVADYSAVRESYQRFCSALESILRTALKGVKTHQISARAKAIESFARKASKPSSEDPTQPKYPNPLNQINDLAAVRVVVFVLNDLPRVEEVVSAQFDRVERSDKGDRLLEEGTVGYRTVHYLVRLKQDRTQLLEYLDFKDMVAEVQIRTILQHAWAEIEHDIRYKSDLEVHKELSQRFAALAGLIEIGDREFDKVVELDAERRKRVRELAQITEEAPKVPEQIFPATEANVGEAAGNATERREVDSGESKHVSPRLLLAEKRYGDAIVAYNELILEEPNQFAHYLGRARARFLMGDAKGALDDLNRADEISPANPLSSRVRQLITGESRSVVVDRDDPTPQLPGLEVGGGEASTAEHELAGRSDLPAAYKPDSYTYLGVLRQGHAQLEQGDVEGAIRLYERAEALGFSPVQTLLNKAIARCVQEKYDICIHLLGKFSPFPGSHLELHVMALYAICRILQGEDVYQYLPTLARTQIALATTTDYVYARTPFRVLERVLQQADDGRFEKVRGVFSILSAQSKRQTSEG